MVASRFSYIYKGCHHGFRHAARLARTQREARLPNPRTAAIARRWRRIKFQDEPVNSANSGRQ
jgi:hypothetical protein